MPVKKTIFQCLKENKLYLLFVVFVVSLIYTKVIRYGLVGYDDNIYLNSSLISSGIKLTSVFKSFVSVINDNWSPITVLSLMVDSQLYGVHGIYGFHISNIVLHVLNTYLVYLLIFRITNLKEVAIWISLFFAAHPLQVESVAWVAERKGLLAAFFYLLSLILYIHFRYKKNKSAYIASLVLFVFGLMAKAVIVMLPIMIVVLEWLYLCSLYNSPTKKKLALYVLPYFIISLIIGVLTIVIQKHSGVLSSEATLPYLTRILNAFVSLKVYIFQTIFPVKFSAFYPYHKSYPLILVLLYILSIISITGTIIYFYNKNGNPNALFGWLWFLVMLLPVLGLIQTGAHAHADRYMYLPIIGLLLAIVQLLRSLSQKITFSKLSPRILGGTLLFVFGMVSWVQASVWKNTETLFLHAADVTRDNYIAHTSLAIYYLKQHENNEAWHQYQLARKIAPKYATLYEAIALELNKQRKYDAALLVLNHMRLAGIETVTGYRISGEILFNAGQYKKSINFYKKVLQINAKDKASMYVIGFAYFRLKDYRLSLDYLHKLETLEPKNSMVLKLMGDVYVAQGNKNMAERYYNLAVKYGNERILK